MGGGVETGKGFNQVFLQKPSTRARRRAFVGFPDGTPAAEAGDRAEREVENLAEYEQTTSEDDSGKITIKKCGNKNSQNKLKTFYFAQSVKQNGKRSGQLKKS